MFLGHTALAELVDGFAVSYDPSPSTDCNAICSRQAIMLSVIPNARCLGKNDSLIKVGMRDEDIICYGDLVDVEIFWQHIWTVKPGVEEDDETIGTKTIGGSAYLR